jgi:branched-chain amino acid transport system substrate-binding protein
MARKTKSGAIAAPSRRQVLAGGGALTLGVAMPWVARAQAKDIVIGGVLPLTGPSAGFGQMTWEGIQLACDMANEKGGVQSMGGAKLTAIVGDTESKPEVAASQAEQLIGRGVSVLIGCNQSAASIVASQVAERSSVPFITAYDFDPTLSSRGFKYFFRASPLVTNFSHDIIAFLKELGDKSGDPVKKIGLLSESSIAGQSANKLANEAATKMGFEVVDVSTYAAGETQNFAPFITKLKSAGAEAVIGHNRVSEGIAIVRTMKELGYNPKFIGGILGAPNTREFMDAMGADADNIYSTDSWSPSLTIPGMKEVADRALARFGKAMDPSTATSFSNVAIIWAASEKAKSADPRLLRDAIAATELDIGERDFFLLRGVKFAANGENERAASLIGMCQNKQAVAVWPAEVATTAAVYPKPAWS